MYISAISDQKMVRTVAQYVHTQSITSMRRSFQICLGKTPHARRTILTNVEILNNLGNLENNTDREIPTALSWAGRLSVPISARSQLNPWRKWHQIRSFCTKPYRLCWTGSSLVSVQDNKTTSFTTTIWCSTSYLSKSCKTTCHSILAPHIALVLLMNVSFLIRIAQQSKHSFLEHM